MTEGKKKAKKKEEVEEVTEVVEENPQKVEKVDIKKPLEKKLSAVEYALTYNKEVNLAKILPVLDKKYRRDQVKSEWDFAFIALKSKPSKISWNEHITNLKRGNK